MNYLSYPPEILQNIIDDNFEIWKKIFVLNKYFHKTLTISFLARLPLQNRFGKWYFLAYLKLTKKIFRNDRNTISEEIVKSLPEDIEKATSFELIQLVLEDEYVDIYESVTQTFNNKFLNLENETIEILANAFIKKNDDFILVKLISQDKKDGLKVKLFRKVIDTVSDAILRRVAFIQIENSGFMIDEKVTIAFRDKSIFDAYVSAVFKDRGKLLLEAFDYVIKRNADYDKLADDIFKKMKPRDVVLSLSRGYFDNIVSDDFSYNLIKKLLDYSKKSSEFIVFVRNMINKKINFNFTLCRKVILERKRKVTFILDALASTTEKSIDVIRKEILDSLKNLSDKRQKEIAERLE